jgi:hypothetical protein
MEKSEQKPLGFEHVFLEFRNCNTEVLSRSVSLLSKSPSVQGLFEFLSVAVLAAEVIKLRSVRYRPKL